MLIRSRNPVQDNWRLHEVLVRTVVGGRVVDSGSGSRDRLLRSQELDFRLPHGAVHQPGAIPAESNGQPTVLLGPSLQFAHCGRKPLRGHVGAIRGRFLRAHEAASLVRTVHDPSIRDSSSSLQRVQEGPGKQSRRNPRQRHLHEQISEHGLLRARQAGG